MTAGVRRPDDVRTRTEFGEALTALRVDAGVTVRDVARSIAAPTATVGDYFSGRHLPSLTQVDLFRGILRTCGVIAEADVRAWLAALARARVSSDGRAAKADAPYRGLQPFQPGDRALFFGRDTAIRQVSDRLVALRDEPDVSGGLMAVVGPSGSGKSSLLRAGVMPAINGGALDSHPRRWQSVLMTPGADPAVRFGELVDEAHSPIAVVVDQFEELFTLAAADAAREFVERLSNIDPTHVLIVCGLRADYYADAAKQPLLLPMLQRAQVLLGPMTTEEVRAAIIEPAHQVGAVVDDGLVELLLADLAPRTVTGYAHDPGALPLLSHALLATWDRATRNQLTVADYRAVGGLHGAVQQTAETLFAELPPADQDVARRVFLRLVTVDEATVTRRAARRVELADEPSAGDLLDRFIAERLITADADVVQISHEALLTAWPRLREWIDADRDGLRIQRQLTEAANAWQAHADDDSLLARGARLSAAADWAAQPEHAVRLNDTERRFLAASHVHAERERSAARRRARRLQQLVAGLAVALLAAAVLSGVALHAEAAAATAHNQALSRQVALEAEKLEPTDPGLAAQLALAAYRISPTTTARGTLLDATSGELPTRLVGRSGPTFVALSSDGHLLAVTGAGDATVHLYRLTGATPQPLGVTAAPATAGAPAQMFTVAISPNGSLLATGGTDDRVTLWRISDPTRPQRLATLTPISSAVQDVAFSRDGTTLAAVGDDAVHRYDITNPTQPHALTPLPVPGSNETHGITYSGDGHWLAADGANGVIAIWPADTTQPTPAATLTGGTSTLTGLAFNPAGTLLAATSGDTLVRVYQVSAAGQLQPAHDPLTGLNSVAYGPSFSADGHTLVVGSSDGTAHLWDTSSWSDLGSFPHPGPVTATAINTAAGIVVTGDADGTTRIWTIPAPTMSNLPSNVYELDYTPNGHTLLSVGGGSHGAATLWNTTDARRPAKAADIALPATFGPPDGAGTMSADGKLAALPNAKAAIQLIDTSDPGRPRLVGAPLTGPTPLIEQLAFSPDSHLLGAADDANQVHLWDTHDPAHPVLRATITGPGSIVLFDQFSPDGKLLALASASNKVQLWNVANPSHPNKVATLGGFTNYAVALAFTPDGKTLVAGSADHTIRLWNITDPRKPRPQTGPITACDDYVYYLSMAPDGHMVAAACGNHTVALWDITSPTHPRLRANLAADAAMYVVAFSPDRHTLAGSGADHTIRQWTYQPAAAAELVCHTAGDPISRAEWAQYVPGAGYHPPCP